MNDIAIPLSGGHYDVLTGLKNRYALEPDFSRYRDKTVYVLLTKINDFRLYALSSDLELGDKVLITYACMLKRAFGYDNCYRTGDSEFLVIQQDTDKELFLETAKKIQDSFFLQEINGRQLTSSINGGYVYGHADTPATLHNMIRMAGLELFAADKQGNRAVKGSSFKDAMQNQTNLLSAVGVGIPQESDFDTLTGLPNMNYFRTQVKKILPLFSKERQCVFVYFDIDNFKAYNNEFGFKDGDNLLKSVAFIIQDAFPQRLLSRFSDDHFVVCVFKDELEAVITSIHTVITSLSKKGYVDLKAGVYEYQDGVSISAACDFAKAACDSIKGQYSTYYRYYDETLEHKIKLRQYIINNLRKSFDAGRIKVYYQPVIRSLSGNICGLEALSRWETEEYGQLMPSDYIGILEDSHLIHKHDMYMVEQICRDYTQMQAEHTAVPISINLSRVDFMECDVIGIIEMLVKKYNVPKQMLNFEVTESAEGRENLSSQVATLRKAGYEIWMDDFGSGYSSLNDLKEYEFDVLKNDMQFLTDFNDTEKALKSRIILNSNILMAKKLGIRTLAEGVETEDQMNFLKNAGCDILQGYFYSKPIPLANLKGLKLQYEDPEDAEYYNVIGRTQLINSSYLTTDNYSMSDIRPALLFEYKKNSITVLTYNDAYVQFLHEAGFESVNALEQQLNNPSNSRRNKFLQAGIRAIEDNTVQDVQFTVGEKDCSMSMQVIATNRRTKAVCLIGIMTNIEHITGRKA